MLARNPQARVHLASQRQLRVSCRARVRAIPERAPAKDENEAPGIEVAGLLLRAECGHPLRPKRVPRFGAFQQPDRDADRTSCGRTRRCCFSAPAITWLALAFACYGIR